VINTNPPNINNVVYDLTNADFHLLGLVTKSSVVVVVVVVVICLVVEDGEEVVEVEVEVIEDMDVEDCAEIVEVVALANEVRNEEFVVESRFLRRTAVMM
jgi:hypothetical protein